MFGIGMDLHRPDSLHLRSTVAVQASPGLVAATFTVAAGVTVAFVASWAPADRPVPPPLDPATALAETEAFWQAWADRCAYQGRWRDAMVRSLRICHDLLVRGSGAQICPLTVSQVRALVSPA